MEKKCQKFQTQLINLKFFKKLENWSLIVGNFKNFCNILAQTKLRNVYYRLPLYFLNFEENILKNETVIFHELLQDTLLKKFHFLALICDMFIKKLLKYIQKIEREARVSWWECVP